MKKKRVYIIVLNYNNWADTLECAESILSNNYQNYQLVIVDNHSLDNSMQYIKDWANGKIEVFLPSSNPLKSLVFPLSAKPLNYDMYEDRKFIKTFNNSTDEKKLILIESSKNNGYSAGNNLGISYALAQEDCNYIWILNNDTVVEKEALRNLVDYMSHHQQVGVLGSTLLFYDAPTKIQTFGGSFNRYFAVQKHNLAHEEYSVQKIETFDMKKVDYIVGASMLMSKKYLQVVGLMPEEYFIYFEEIDIATNCKKHGLDIDICKKAIVYHKESVSIKKENSKTSAFSDFYAMRNRLIFTKKYHPLFLPTVYFGLFLSLLLRVSRGETEKVKNILKIIVTPISKMEGKLKQ